MVSKAVSAKQRQHGRVRPFARIRGREPQLRQGHLARLFRDLALTNMGLAEKTAAFSFVEKWMAVAPIGAPVPRDFYRKPAPCRRRSGFLRSDWPLPLFGIARKREQSDLVHQLWRVVR